MRVSQARHTPPTSFAVGFRCCDTYLPVGDTGSGCAFRLRLSPGFGSSIACSMRSTLHWTVARPIMIPRVMFVFRELRFAPGATSSASTSRVLGGPFVEVPDDESSVGPWAPLSGSLSLLTCCLLFRRVVLPEPVPIRGLFVVLEHPPASLRHGLWLHVVFQLLPCAYSCP